MSRSTELLLKVKCYVNSSSKVKSHAMTQAVSRRPVTAEVRVLSQSFRVGFMVDNDNGTGFSPVTSVFPCQCHSNTVPCLFFSTTDAKK